MRDPREEAERLVAAALAAVSMAARSTTGFATGSAECCVCPLCKAIAAARDPDPDLAERLATGAGDVAAGVASFLRQFNAPRTAAAGETPPQEPGPAEPAAGAEHARKAEPAAGAGRAGTAQDGGDPWHQATQAPHPQQESHEQHESHEQPEPNEQYERKPSTTDSDVAQD